MNYYVSKSVRAGIESFDLGSEAEIEKFLAGASSLEDLVERLEIVAEHAEMKLKEAQLPMDVVTLLKDAVASFRRTVDIVESEQPFGYAETANVWQRIADILEAAAVDCDHAAGEYVAACWERSVEEQKKEKANESR